VEQDVLFKIIPTEKYDLLTREELIILAKGEQDLRLQMQKEVQRLRALNDELEQKTLSIQDQLIVIKNKLFGRSSEKTKNKSQSSTIDKTKKRKVLLPSERYPDAPLIERHVEFGELPSCKCCGGAMKDSGMTEDSEYLTVVPAEFYIVKQKRHKYRCTTCHGDLQTAPCPPRIKEGSSYSDEMIIDVSLSKYCDLIPVERYTAIAGRTGLNDLPAQSLIEGTHHLADFLKPVYEELKQEIVSSKVLHADETTHRMLEGDKTKSWYLWGFSNKNTSYFELHNTRSGNVASQILSESVVEYLVSDVFSGYGKSVKDSNKVRREKELPLIKNVYCNAHARRKFKEIEERFEIESKFFIDQYKEIYRLEKESREKPPDKVLEVRLEMKRFFEKMREYALMNVASYSSKSLIAKAMNYFLGNYEELTLFLSNIELPIDNNPQERLLRSPVFGRKTFYGNHSKRGAETAAILF
jgi:transposase